MRFAASPNEPAADTCVYVPLRFSRCTVARPFVIATRTLPLSTARLSHFDAARSAANVAFIVAGAKPAPRADAVSVSDVTGPLARTVFKLNTFMPNARS